MRVVIWKNAWLPRSETFIRDQVAAYQVVQPITFGLVRLRQPLKVPDIALMRNPRLLMLSNRVLTRWPVVDRAAGRVAAIRLLPERPDLVHAHFGIDGITAEGAAGVLRCPLAVTFHGYDASATRRPGLGRYFAGLPRLFRSSAALIAVSTFVADQLLALGAPRERVHVHHIGVKLPPRDALSAGDRGYVVFVGRLVPKKGVDVLLRAFAQLLPALRSTQILIIGEGPLRADLEQLAGELGLNATFTGRLSSDEVARYVRDAYVACVPSKQAPDGDSEGLPMVVLEAGSWGVPVVAADHAGIRDAISDGQSGLLFPEGDARGLAAVLSELLHDRGARNALGAAARDAVEERFDIIKQTEVLEQIYLDLIH